jgi:hypothetical protein
MLEFILGVKIFLFIFCLLNVVKNIYNFIKVMRLESGSLNNGKYGTIYFGLSLSYVLTLLIIGF